MSPAGPAAAAGKPPGCWVKSQEFQVQRAEISLGAGRASQGEQPRAGGAPPTCCQGRFGGLACTPRLYVRVALRARRQSWCDPAASTCVCVPGAPAVHPPAPRSPGRPRLPPRRTRLRGRCSAGPARGAAAPPARRRVMQGRGGAGGCPRACFARRGLFCTAGLFFTPVFVVRSVLFRTPGLVLRFRVFLPLPFLFRVPALPCTAVAARFHSAPRCPLAIAAAAGCAV